MLLQLDKTGSEEFFIYIWATFAINDFINAGL